MEDPAIKLMDEFRSLIDETAILSISSDYNLQNTQEFSAAREVLLAISKDVETEEATGFNPSGFGGDSVADLSASNRGDDAEDTGATGSDMKSAGGFTTTTESSVPPSLSSSGSSTTASGDTPDLVHVGIFDGLSDGEKEKNLSEMFVELKPIDIKKALEKSKGDASLAMDELLNLQWLEHTGQRPKGIDGFFVDESHSPNKKKRRKKKGKAAKVPSLKPPGIKNITKEVSQSTTIQTDKIAFIADRLNLPLADVASIYNRRNNSLGATVIEILDNYISLDLPQTDPRLLSDIQQETVKFSWIPRDYIKAIFEICQLRDEALDVIEILADYFEKPAYRRYDISYSVVASDPEAAVATIDLTAASNLKHAVRPSTNLRSPTVDSPRGLSSQAANLSAASAASKAFAESRNHSFTSAAAAFKKGRSDSLFRQAGSFYAERAREQAASYRQASSVEANFLVDQQSTRDTIDLHGVTVQDGVDIALDRVRRWWDGLGEERARKVREGEGLTVVTGLGRHSADGKSPLRVNVFRALLADGWKAEVQTGSYRVTGRR